METQAGRSGRSRTLITVLVTFVAILALFWLLLGEGSRFACTGTVPALPVEDGVNSAALGVDESKPVELVHEPDRSETRLTPASEPKSSTAPVQGRVLDARTREGVGGVIVDLACANAHDRVKADAGGWFESKAVFPRGSMTARVLDDSAAVGSDTTDYDPAVGLRNWFVSVPIGPTIPFATIDQRRVDLEAKWEARIVESTLDLDFAGELRATESTLEVVKPDPKLPDREWPWLALREGTPPFVRYASIVHQPDARYTARVEIRGLALMARSNRAHRVGSRAIARTVGIQAPTALVTREVYDVFGRLVDPRQRALPAPAYVVFGTSGARSSRGGIAWRDTEITLAKPDGTFRFSPQALSEVTVRAFVPGYRSASAMSRSSSDDEQGIRIDLEPCNDAPSAILPPVDAVDPVLRPFTLFVVRSASFGLSGPVWLFSPGRDLPTAIEWGALPCAEYSVEPLGLWLLSPWCGPIEKIVLPRSDLASLRATEPRSEPFRFRATNASENGAVLSFDVLLGPEGSLLRTIENAWSVDLELDDRAPLVWSLWSKGFAPAYGTAADFVVSDGARIATGRLERGYGAELYFRKQPLVKTEVPEGPIAAADPIKSLYDLERYLGSSPLSNVRLLGSKDGELDVTSDASGVVRLSTPEPPPVIRVQRAGWQVERVERLFGVGRIYVVWMKPQ